MHSGVVLLIKIPISAATEDHRAGRDLITAPAEHTMTARFLSQN